MPKSFMLSELPERNGKPLELLPLKREVAGWLFVKI
jgi:hypothetical protein